MRLRKAFQKTGGDDLTVRFLGSKDFHGVY
jgi:hypothetical protein